MIQVFKKNNDRIFEFFQEVGNGKGTCPFNYVKKIYIIDKFNN